MLDALLHFVVTNDIRLPATLTGALVLLLVIRGLSRFTIHVPGEDWAPPPRRG